MFLVLIYDGHYQKMVPKKNQKIYTVDHHSLEYGPSNKNLFQTMGVFHTMGGQKNNFFL